MGTIKADTVTGLADPNKATIPNTITMGSTTATLNFGNTVIANASAGSSTITGEGGSTTTNLQQGLVKGFICVDVSSGAAFSSDDSFNIASVSDSGTGHFALGFTNNMATIRYNSPGGCYTATGTTVGVTGEATTGTNLRISDNGGSASDTDSYMAFIGTMA